MEDYNGYETVKERLILAGISELQKHSIEDLSIRKVAALCNVSCAAPYKHFKDKDDFLSEIYKYINVQWTKLRKQIINVFKDDSKAQVIEVCVAYIKFCIANPNYRNVIVMKKGDREEITPEENFYNSKEENLIRKFCTKKFKDKETVENKVFIIHNIVYGTIYMISEGLVENSDETIKKARFALNDELK